MRVTSELRLREIDGEAAKGVPPPAMAVTSHVNDASLVVLILAGRTYSVKGADLLAATTNAMNVPVDE